MDSEERKKLNRLSRKSCGQNFKKRILKNRIAQNKASFKAQKHLNAHNSNQASTSKCLEFSTDMLKACADINAITSFTGEDMGFLQKHIRQLTSHLVHTSIRIMEQNMRGTPQTSDIDAAAQALGLDVPFSAGTGELLPVRTGGRNAAPGAAGKMFFIRREKEVDIKTLLRREPAPVVYDVSLSVHWLAIDGVQPTSPQNPPPDFLRRMAKIAGCQSSISPPDSQPAPAATATVALKTTGSSIGGASKTEDFAALTSTHPRVMQACLVDRRSHDVSQELMLYFRELTEACVGANENRRHEALDNAAQDTGLQPLLPYLITFITEGVRVNVSNNNLAILIYLMRLTKALIDNQHISLEAYLHLIVPTVTTCILCRQLCAKPITDNHWALRDYAAKQLVTLCNRYNTSSNGLYNRITRELYRVMCTWIEGRSQGSGDAQPPPTHPSEVDSSNSPAPISMGDEGSSQPCGGSNTTGGKLGGVSLGMAANSLNTLYGVLIALCEFGPNCLRMLVFPMLPSLTRRLVSVMESPGGTETPSLSQADLRSMESLKTLMMNRLAPLLGEWRVRQNLSLSPEAYKADYGAIANSLMTAVTRNQSAVALTPASSAASSTTATTSSVSASLIVIKPHPPN